MDHSSVPLHTHEHQRKYGYRQTGIDDHKRSLAASDTHPWWPFAVSRVREINRNKQENPDKIADSQVQVEQVIHVRNASFSPNHREKGEISDDSEHEHDREPSFSDDDFNVRSFVIA